jgi:rhodanese-related sulfurtransferase
MPYKITTSELLTLMNARKNLKLVDVHPRVEYEREHIHEAISLPESEIEKKP